MSYRSRRPRKPAKATFSLNITSMTDMFTMLLVFLLQSYATSDIHIELDPNVRLPLSSSMKEPTKAPQVVVTPQEIRVDGEKVVILQNGAPNPSDLDPKNPQLIKPLLEVLKTKRPADGSQDAVLLHADAGRDLASLSSYFVTISAAGYPKVKLATVVGR